METTFEHDLDGRQEMLGHLGSLTQKVVFLLMDRETYARMVTSRVKYSGFTTVTRSQTMMEPVNEAQVLLPTVSSLL